MYITNYVVSWSDLPVSNIFFAWALFIFCVVKLYQCKNIEFESAAQKKLVVLFFSILLILGAVGGAMSSFRIPLNKIRLENGEYQYLEAKLVNMYTKYGSMRVLSFDGEDIGVTASSNSCFPGDDDIARTFQLEVGATYKVKYFKHENSDYPRGCILELKKISSQK